MRKTRPGIERYYDTVIYAPSYMKFRKFLHKSNIPYYYAPLQIKRLEWFTKVFENLPLPFSPTTYFKIEDFDIYPIAQSHLDAAWLWSVNDTKVRAYKTFHLALKHIQEYPYFSISLTSPQYFNWIKKYDPEMWEKVKEQVARKKIDICGGMWIEPALCMCSGEALVRQRLYGQLFYLRNFGKISAVESLLDVFGFPYTLPQILVKSGAQSFWTTKLTWNDYSRFPYSNYIWKGLDGSEIFTHLFKFQIASMPNFGLYRIMGRRPKENGLVLNSHNSLKEMNEILTDDHVRTLGLFYGKGDGGKGPIFTEIQYMENLAKYYGFKHANTHQYFEILKHDVGDRIVTWDDEMYLEYHRGCSTTQVRVKKGNRKAEESTIAGEFLATFFLLSPEFKNFVFPKDLFEDCWQKTLFNQFHDILPGSSIPEVYLLTWKEHDYVVNVMQNLIKENLVKISHGSPASQGDILVYNPVSVSNDAIIRVEDTEYLIQNIEPFSTLMFKKQDLKHWYDEDHSEIRADSLETSIRIENELLSVTFSKNTGNLTELNLKHQNSIDNFLYGNRNAVKERTEKLVMKNNTIKKRMERFKGARVNVFREPMKGRQQYPAWNIDHFYTQYPVKLTLVEGPKVEKSEHKVVVKSKYSFKKSSIELIYTIRAKSDVVDVHFKIDLQDKKTILKYFVPLNLHSEQVRCEIPYGSIIRSRNPKSEMEIAKWEYGMQKWVDVSDRDVGLAILNDSKYGLSANMKGISITLVRSPHYPKDIYHTREIKFEQGQRPNYTDLGLHEFTLRLVPHKGSWINNKIPYKAIAFNNPCVCLEIEKPFLENNQESRSELYTNTFEERGLKGQKIVLPRVTSDHTHIIISTLKPSEWISKDARGTNTDNFYHHEDYILPESPEEWVWDNKTLILRAYEWAGTQVSMNIRFHNICEKFDVIAEEIDLLEYKVGKKLDVRRNTANNSVIIRADFKHNEIKTIRLLITER